MHRLIAPIVFSTILTIGTATTLTLYNNANQANEMRAEEYADQAVDRVVDRLGQHLSLLRATNAFFQASNKRVNRQEFKTFISGLEIESRYPGIQGIGFAELINTGDEDKLEQILHADYSQDSIIWPETKQTQRTPIILLEPLDPRNEAAIGYDMYHETVRRAAIQKALDTGSMTASGPVELVQEITSTKQTGFLVYMPFHDIRPDGLSQVGKNGSKPLEGLVYSPFRAGDLFTAALSQRPQLPVAINAIDTENPDFPLFVSKNFENQDLYDHHIVREVEIAGRTWKLDVKVAKKASLEIQDIAPYISAVVFFLLATMLAWITHSQLRALFTAHAMRELSEKNLSEKELLLQEMKHRIKNSIARILAMARQTAHHSENLEEFSQSFNARLQAMANAQDALTRSHWQRADLSDLLAGELKQVLGEDEFRDQISGPTVNLDETSAQALGLTFHELATNALKYSDVANSKEALMVSWKIISEGKEKRLNIRWKETSKEQIKAPDHKGFGTRLIDANIRGELRGKIERIYGDDGLLIDITIPMPSALPMAKPSKRNAAAAGTSD